MRLSATILTGVASVNSFQEQAYFEMTEGDAVEVFLQLRDISVNPLTAGFNPAGRRYVPAVGATLQVEVCDLDDAKKVTRYATQAFPDDDRSIWSFPIMATDVIRGTKSIKLVLTENGTVTRGVVQAAIRSQNLNGVSTDHSPRAYPIGYVS